MVNTAAIATPATFDTPEIIERQTDTNELRDDCEAIENEQIDDAERPPELAETLKDKAGVADASDRAQTQYHFLIDIKHRDQQQQCPQKRGPIVLSRLGIGGKRTRVIVANHDDETGPENCQERHQTCPPGGACVNVAVADGAKRAANVTDMRRVEDGRY